ncbi:MAG: hypothetical protein B6U77_01600 [Candidatus Hecatellales archaeon ex4484_218]|nr:MAG: hypothetical protein B6U77_01600 [Candidatus Hecatellales archaeon ex4484_218]
MDNENVSEELEQKIISVLKDEVKGAAVLLVSKKVGLNPTETRKILEALVEKGLVERKGRNYKLKT